MVRIEFHLYSNYEHGKYVLANAGKLHWDVVLYFFEVLNGCLKYPI